MYSLCTYVLISFNTYVHRIFKDTIARANYSAFSPKAFIFNKNPVLKTILSEQQLTLTVKRLAHQILENNLSLTDTVIIGLQPRGIFLSDRIVHELKNIIEPSLIIYGKLDITFYRDDVRKSLHIANATDIPFSIENKKVVLIDDVLYTGRTIRAALDALLDFGRPSKVSLCVLVDRRFNRELPIQPDYAGKTIDTFISQKVKVCWKEKDEKDEVVLI
jgi:pyrimidine operon attenuation protein/uracil phosphoribosyltransferase